MIREIKTVDEKKQIIRITSLDSRFYARPSSNPETGLPEFKYYPSVTWICSYYYKSPYLIKWIADKGLTESENLRNEAATRGSKVHQAIDLLERTKELPIEVALLNPSSGQPEQMTSSELDCVLSFVRWHTETKPKVLATEMIVFGEDYAGQIDRIYQINGQVWVCDFKTSKMVYETMRLQLSAYSHAEIDYASLNISKEDWDKRKLAVLQLGYSMNKMGWKWTEVPDKYDLFRMVVSIFKNENPDTKPKSIEIPLIIKLKGATVGL